ncbi:acetyl-CoA hydrolase/transferase C-terminal domain-containing protein [Novosphingobium sp.]|uniref:acetyl-CoA hydrolase/transferase C-terminal domain-containing protein n=1 Tax=Novosphingobium sp. TaxID=1874826 RepID=UPI002611C126|nr:acetyl-CoA hydrolase/transferase C-terminal domain-containing protein [Novosphingobium sp.]
MSESVLADVLRPGDRVVVGQATSEPVGLVQDLFAAAAQIDDLTAFCGFSLNPAWKGAVPDALGITTYCGLGSIGALTRRGRAKVIPFAMSQLSSALAARTLPADVVLLQVSPADADGYHSLGFAADYVWEAAHVARVVVAEVNARVPITRSPCRLHRSQIVIARVSNTPLPEAPPEPPGEVQTRVAREVAKLVPDGATLQIGIGKLSDAVAHALQDRRGLKIRSGMVGDWFPALVDAGAIDTASPDACLASLAVGSGALYDWLGRSDRLGFALPEQLVALIPGSPFMAINSGIEVDLRGQVNAEFLGDRYVGASSGQTDYFRAARRSVGGLAILALPSANERSDESRIVRRIASGFVTSAQSDVDMIITEHGAADIRATDFDERSRRIAAIADPRQRGALTS